MMKLRLPALILSLMAAGSLPAQSPPSYQEPPYKEPYDAWVRYGAELERDASVAREKLAVRTDRAAAEATKYENARKELFDAQRAQILATSNQLPPLSLALDISSDSAATELFSAQDAALAKSIGALANDPDEGIQRLRRALDKERNALAAAKSGVEARQSSTGAVQIANDSVERAAKAAEDQIKAIADNFEESAASASGLADAWPGYYRALASGARGVALTDVAPPFVSRSAAPLGTSNPLPAPTPASAPQPTIAAPAARPPNGLPLTRYTGAWEFLKGVSTFTGLPPTAFNVEVKIENGQMSGTVSATFDALPKTDPAVKFTFAGPMQAGREQSFPLQTAEGAAGKVTLIPASAFNLLEVRFTLENAPGKVAESGVILIKKL